MLPALRAKLMSSSPHDSAVLITGAAGGIGQALCAEFLAAGWHVLATDHPSAIPAQGSPLPALTWLTLDLAAYVGDAAVRQTFAAQVRATLATSGSKPLTCLVNNAAVQQLGATAAVTTEDWDVGIAINLVAPFLLTQAFLPELEANQGSVVNIASVHAQLTKPGFVVYATAKAALSATGSRIHLRPARTSSRSSLTPTRRKSPTCVVPCRR